MKLSIDIREYALKKPFRITGHVFNSSRVVEVSVTDANGIKGRGETSGAYYLGESAESMARQCEAIAASITSATTRADVQNLLPPCGARNAIDCAFWDLEARQANQSVWQLTGIEPKPLTTVFTIGIEDSPAKMADNALVAAEFPVLKIKMDGDRPIERMQAIRAARPDAEIVVDANQGWTFEQLVEVAPAFADLNIAMIEQPLARGGDQALEGYDSPVILCADESCLHLGEIDEVARRYQMINIKLDKSGGLTEGLAMAAEAQKRGLQLMVGNMMGSSLAMAPGTVIAQLCRFVDLDGPLLLKEDCDPALVYEKSTVHPTTSDLWG
jgi:L-alanine-DL-glutamate epimerase-like enolase superfamily enzyme